MESPDTVTVLLFATVLVVNAPEADPVSIFTVSPEITPFRPAEPKFKVALRSWLYSLFSAVIFVAVSCLAVIFAVVL